MNVLRDAALAYAEHGWAVIPLHSIRNGACTCGRPDCGSPGKHPRTPSGLKDASIDPETIRGWWNKSPSANVGIVTGGNFGVVLDIDARHDGHESLAQLEIEHGPLPPTMEAATGGGGRHLIFKHPGGEIRNRTGIHTGIDVKADKGTIVAAPSVHASGVPYKWREGHGPDDIEPAPMPGWLLELLTKPATAPRPTAGTNGDGLARLMDDAGRYVAKAAGASEGNRNASAFGLAGHILAFATDDGHRLTETQALDLLRGWNWRNAPPLAESELAAAVASAAKNGTARPVHLVHTTPAATSKRKPPEPVELLPFRPFPVDALPERVRVFVEAVAKATGTDPAFAAVAALVVLAGCIGNRAAALVKSGWVEPAVLWGAIVGKSGVTKTPVLKLATRALIELFKAGRRAFADAQAQYLRDIEHHAVRMTEWKQKQKQGPPTDPPEEPTPPCEKRLMVSDITVEKLGAMLQDNPLGLLLVSDELAAWIGRFDRYASGGKGSDRPTWLSFYDASPVAIDRKGGGSLFCERAAVSVLGGIQPRTLTRVFGAAEREAGLLARVLLAWPPERPALWTDDGLPDDVADDWRDLVAELLALQPGVDDDGDPRPLYLPIGQDAKPLWVEWQNKHVRETADSSNEDLGAYLAKLKGGCVRFALVLECVNVATGYGGRACIGVDAMQRAIRIVEWFKHEGRRVYAMLADTDDQRAARGLADWIQKRGGAVTARDITHGIRKYRGDTDAAKNDLDRLAAAGLGRWNYPRPGVTGGPPAGRFELTPVTITPAGAAENGGYGDGDSGDSLKNAPEAAPVDDGPEANGDGYCDDEPMPDDVRFAGIDEAGVDDAREWGEI